MADPDELQFLQDSADDWNMHRREQQWMHPDLSGANLTNATLLQSDLTETNLTNGDLSGVPGLNLDNARGCRQ